MMEKKTKTTITVYIRDNGDIIMGYWKRKEELLCGG